MSGIAGAINQPDQIDSRKCARNGCDAREGEPHPVTGKSVGCLKVAAAVRGVGVRQWCSRACYDAENANR